MEENNNQLNRQQQNNMQQTQQENQQRDQQLNQSMQNDKKVRLMILGVAILVIGLVGITYAFFNYTRTGTANTIKVGRIAFNSNQTDSVNLTNVFPISSTAALTDTTNTDEAVITITGDTTYPNGVEYLVKVVNVQNTVGTGANQKYVPIKIMVSASNGLGTSDADYFTDRGSTTSYYKVLSDGTVENDGKILVGYIASGQTGINGTVTIKAYLDSDNVKISDTYDGTESDNMGTTNEWVGGKVVLTTAEWNSLQASGVSFQVRVEANEGVWVPEEVPMYDEIINQSAPNSTVPIDTENSTYVQNVSTGDISNARVSFLNNVEDQGKVIKLSAGINFNNAASDTNGQGLYIRGGTENDTYPIYYYRGHINNNNVAFAGFCWLIVRTTDTGGIKMIYNGLQDEDGTCTATAYESTDEATVEIPELLEPNKRIGDMSMLAEMSEFGDSDGDFLSSVGYMYGEQYEMFYTYYTGQGLTSGAYFGSGFTYNNGVYTLTDATVTAPDATHHYSCDSTNASATCSEIIYVYNEYSGEYSYLKMSGGDGIDDVLTKSFVNTHDSPIKTAIDTWYASNLASYTSKLEDTVWCNDRSISELGRWSATSSITSTEYLFNAGERGASHTPTLECSRRDDQFTVSSSIGNGKLTYPVGLLTGDELIFAGSADGYGYGLYLWNWKGYWTMTPATEYAIHIENYGGMIYLQNYYYSYGVRPAISLKHNIKILNGGDGTAANPYVVE